MKELFLIKDTLPNKISYYHLLLFFASLPFDRFYSQVILISFAFHTFIHFKKTDLKTLYKHPILLLALVFILTAAGALYTQHQSKAFQELDKQLAILLLPILLAISHPKLAKYQNKLMRGLAISCTLSILYLYYDALRIIILKSLPFSDLISESFINHNFSSPVSIHATYLSMYAAFSLIYFLAESFKARSIRKRIEYSVFILILALGIIQLCSKSVFIALLIAILAAPFFLFHGMKKIRILSYSIILCISVLVTIFQIGPLRNHFFTELSKDLAHSQTPDLTDSRATRWSAALSVIERAPVFGYGSGSETDILGEEYFSRKLYHSYLNKLNAHNQYLSFTIKFGVAGIIIYLSTLLYGFRMAITQKDLLFFSFLILIAIVSFSENILDVNKGIFFYSSWFSLFIFSVKYRRLPVTSSRLPVKASSPPSPATGNWQLTTNTFASEMKHDFLKQKILR